MASVVAVGAECDVALLKVDDPAFFEGIKPITFGGLPRLQDNVAVVRAMADCRCHSLRAGPANVLRQSQRAAAPVCRWATPWAVTR